MPRKGKLSRLLRLKRHDQATIDKRHDQATIDKLVELQGSFLDWRTRGVSEGQVPGQTRLVARLTHELLERYSVAELARETGVHTELIFVLDKIHARGEHETPAGDR